MGAYETEVGVTLKLKGLKEAQKQLGAAFKDFGLGGTGKAVGDIAGKMAGGGKIEGKDWTAVLIGLASDILEPFAVMVKLMTTIALMLLVIPALFVIMSKVFGVISDLFGTITEIIRVLFLIASGFLIVTVFMKFLEIISDGVVGTISKFIEILLKPFVIMMKVLMFPFLILASLLMGMVMRAIAPALVAFITTYMKGGGWIAALGAFFNTVVLPSIDEIGAEIDKVLGFAEGTGASYLDGIFGTLIGMWNWVTGIDWVGLITGIYSFVEGIWNYLSQAVGRVFEGGFDFAKVGQELVKVWEQVKPFLKSLWDTTIGPWLDGIKTMLFGTVGAGRAGTVTAINEGDKAGEASGKSWTPAAALEGGIFSGIANTFNQLSEWLNKLIEAPVETIVSTIATLIEQIEKNLTKTKVFSQIRRVAEGLYAWWTTGKGSEGLTQWTEAINGFILDLTDLSKAVKNILSFSGWLAQFGAWLADIALNPAKAFTSAPPTWTPFTDFIMRPGGSPVAFSPGDTIIGVKNPAALLGGGGGANTVNITVNAPINNAADADALVRTITKKLEEEFRNRNSYGGW